MTAFILLLVKIGGVLLLGSFALVVVVVMLISLALIFATALQLVGILPRVPLGYNVRNLIVRWRISLLTGLAFTLVVALMTVMLAFVNGMFVLTKGSAIPGNVMVLADGATDEVFSDLGYGDIDKLATDFKGVLKTATVEIEGQKREVRLLSWELFQVVNQPIPNAKPGGRMRRFVQVRGVEEPVISSMVHNLPLFDGGKWFSPAGVQRMSGQDNTEGYIQGVLGEGLARELGHDLGKPSMQIGDTFELGPRNWIVVGIMKSAGKTYDSEVWAKRELVGKMLRKEVRSTAVLRVKDELDPAEVARTLTKEFKSPAIGAKTEIEYFESLNATNEMFLNAIIFVALIMAVGGVFGIMNTMFAAIAQRTRDIGVLRILGFARWQILLSFFLESLLLAVVGGLLGCAIGSICDGWSATSQISSGQGGGKSVMLKMVVDARIIGAGLGFALVMGCVGGLLPALSAIRLKVLDSLR